tara:strand:+ start:1270 stop:3414 length:2145 start_codon:yes stop_codon:yes gene_type:complete
MGQLNVSNIRGNSPDFTVNVEKDSTLNVESDFNYVASTFPLPAGTTAERPEHAEEGAVYFNTDNNKLEVYHIANDAVGQWCNITTATDGTDLPPPTTGSAASDGVTSVDVTFGGATTSYDLASGSQAFTASGIYDLEVNGLIHLKVEMWGAGGGGASNSSPSRGSAGGYGEAYMSLEAGTYTFIVGEGGEGGGLGSPTGDSSGGYPDGGDCPATYQSKPTGGSGGGSSRFGPQVSDSNKNNSSTAYYLIAGGGGGGSDWVFYSNNRRIVDDARGEGGGWEGGDGGAVYSADNNESDGGGGTQTAGGRGGTAGRNGAGTAGAKYQGGNGNGSGGGGGYYGGGGAGGYYADAGGGSGYVDTSVCKYYKSIRGGTGSQKEYWEAYEGIYSRPVSTTGDGGVTSGNRETARGSNGAVRLSVWNGQVPDTDIIDTAGGDHKFDAGGYRYHVFINDGSFDFTLTNPSTTEVEYLIIGGGGGGGGGDVGGGGGAGGYRTNVPGAISGRRSSAESPMTISAGTFSVVVGDAGLGSSNPDSDGSNGGDSSFNGITSLGGGGGASWRSGSGRNGGSGGGSVNQNTVTTGTPGQGYGGGNGNGSPNYCQGGGGGAGGAGSPAPGQPQAGPGGVGLRNIWGQETRIGQLNNRNFWVAGGGGGAVESSGNPGSGGKGGGGVGGRQTPNLYPGDGLCNTGSGGGGEDNLRGGYGGKGLVILRIPIPEA